MDRAVRWRSTRPRLLRLTPETLCVRGSGETWSSAVGPPSDRFTKAVRALHRAGRHPFSHGTRTRSRSAIGDLDLLGEARRGGIDRCQSTVPEGLPLVRRFHRRHLVFNVPMISLSS